MARRTTTVGEYTHTLSDRDGGFTTVYICTSVQDFLSGSRGVDRYGLAEGETCERCKNPFFEA